jgi:hypothetical protein
LLLACVLFAGAAPRENEERSSPPRGSVALQLTYNVSPDPAWQPGADVTLGADVRREREEPFQSQRYPGPFPRAPQQRMEFIVPDAAVGESVLVQAYMCAGPAGPCVPADEGNPPACAAEVHILPFLRPSCQPAFTWTGGESGEVLCRAECR